jgi:hypothetical protein
MPARNGRDSRRHDHALARKFVRALGEEDDLRRIPYESDLLVCLPPLLEANGAGSG